MATELDAAADQEGQEAYRAGKASDANPYVRSSRKHWNWRNGWLRAKFDDAWGKQPEGRPGPLQV